MTNHKIQNIKFPAPCWGPACRDHSFCSPCRGARPHCLRPHWGVKQLYEHCQHCHIIVTILIILTIATILSSLWWSQVRKYLIPDSNDEIRQEQMREMELIRFSISRNKISPNISSTKQNAHYNCQDTNLIWPQHERGRDRLSEAAGSQPRPAHPPLLPWPGEHLVFN